MPRHIVSPNQVDLVSCGRRDYHVKFRHPTIHREVLTPLTVIVGPEAQADRGLLAIGGTHGDEYEGPVAIRRLMQEIDTKDVKGRLILLPVLSVCAFEAGTSESPADGVNMNRAFPEAPMARSARELHTSCIRDCTLTYMWSRMSMRAAASDASPVFHRSICGKTRSIVVPRSAPRGAMAPASFVIHHNNDPGLLTVSAEQLGKVCIGGEFGWGRAIMRSGVDHARAGILSAAVDHGLLQEREPICSRDGSQGAGASRCKQRRSGIPGNLFWSL